MSATHPRPCMCPICRIGKALDSLDRAHDDWLDRSTETEMALHHLRDEVAWVLDEPWWKAPWRQHQRLRAALRATSPVRIPAPHTGRNEDGE